MPPEIPRSLERLRELCAVEGREFDSIERTVPFRFDVGTNGDKVDELIGRLSWLGGLGIQTVFGSVNGADTITLIEIMAREGYPGRC